MTKLTDTEPMPTTVTLPDHLARSIDDRIEHTQFDSREEYVLAALDALLSAVETHGGRSPNGKVPDETGAVEDQLESLGYL